MAKAVSSCTTSNFPPSMVPSKYAHAAAGVHCERRSPQTLVEVRPPVVALLAAFGLFGIFAIAISVYDFLMMMFR